MLDRFCSSLPCAPRARLLAGSAAFSLLLAQGVLAQEQPASDGVAEGEAAKAIVVTGSRIVRRDYESPSPLATLSATAIRSTGEVTLEKALSMNPQFGLGENSTSTGYGTSGQATLNLRGLGSFRNLVLIDGRRMQPANVQQSVDINTIPRALLESVEVITGGASAVYGSDAIAGVVNFHLKDNYQGLALDAQYNITDKADGMVKDLSALWGTNFGGGRGNVVVALGYSARDTVRFNSREFFRRNQGGTDLRIPSGVYTSSGNAPSQSAVDAAFAQYGYAPGTVAANSGLSFNRDGTLFSASNGVTNFKGDYGNLLYNSGRTVNNLNVFLTLQAPMERYSAFGKAKYELTDDITAFVQGQYVPYDTKILVESGNTALSVPVTNPFIPSSLATILASRPDPAANLTLQKRFYEAGPRVTDRDFRISQVMAGLRGNLAAIDGSWEVYGSHGATVIHERQPGSVLTSSLNTLLNAADGGQSICAGGYNPFGVTTLSSECDAYLVASPWRNTTLKQDVVEANLQGKLFTLPGGQARFAAGLGYRRNTYSTRVDQILKNADVVGVSYTSDSAGSTNVKELYAELLFPLLADRPFVHKLEVDAGYRYSYYNLSGGAHTWKANLIWGPTRALSFRGGFARAVRAPSVGELFVPPSGAVPGIGEVYNGLGDYCDIRSAPRSGANGAAVRALCVAQGVPANVADSFINLQNDTNATNSGNTGIKPETANTFTIGAAFNPQFSTPWFSRFNITLDYYNITVKDAIGVVGVQTSLAKCFNVDGSNPTYSNTNFFCQTITRDSSGLLSDMRQPTLNLGAYKTAGIDFQLDWGIDLASLGLGDGALDINTAIGWLDKFDVQTLPGDVFYHYAGTVGSPSGFAPGSLPTWKAVTTLAWSNKALSLGLRWRFLDKMASSSKATNPSTTTPGVPSYNLFDLFGSISVGKEWSMRYGVNNLFNKAPPVLNGRIGTTEASTYDVLGRTFYLGVGVKF